MAARGAATYRKFMNQKLTFFAALLGILSSIGFGVIGITYESFPLGWYFGLFTAAIVVILVLFYIEISSMIDDLRHIAKVSKNKNKSLHSLLHISKTHSASLYIDSIENFLKIYEGSKLFDRDLNDVIIYIRPRKFDSEASIKSFTKKINKKHQILITNHEFPLNFLYLPASDDTQSGIYLFSKDSINYSDIEYLDTNSEIYKKIYNEDLSSISEDSIFISKISDTQWFIDQIKTSEILRYSSSRGFSEGRLYTNSPEAIYNQQIALSKKQKKILALDMTEVTEWSDVSGLGRCMIENQNSAKESGADIRRIFICPSRHIWENNAIYREQIISVINNHKNYNMGAGLLFQEDIKTPSLIRDAVLYGNGVLWVETVPTTRYSGEGYFTTDLSEIESHINNFERLWNGEFSDIPHLLAQELIDKHAKETK